MEKCQKYTEDIKYTEEATVGQHGNDEYRVHRINRLTTNQFGIVRIKIFSFILH